MACKLLILQVAGSGNPNVRQLEPHQRLVGGARCRSSCGVACRITLKQKAIGSCASNPYPPRLTAESGHPTFKELRKILRGPPL